MMPFIPMKEIRSLDFSHFSDVFKGFPISERYGHQGQDDEDQIAPLHKSFIMELLRGYVVAFTKLTLQTKIRVLSFFIDFVPK